MKKRLPKDERNMNKSRSVKVNRLSINGYIELRHYVLAFGQEI